MGSERVCAIIKMTRRVRQSFEQTVKAMIVAGGGGEMCTV